jgi:hypothetical protein
MKYLTVNAHVWKGVQCQACSSFTLTAIDSLKRMSGIFLYHAFILCTYMYASSNIQGRWWRSTAVAATKLARQAVQTHTDINAPDSTLIYFNDISSFKREGPVNVCFMLGVISSRDSVWLERRTYLHSIIRYTVNRLTFTTRYECYFVVSEESGYRI